jgi:hypothetical protein
MACAALTLIAPITLGNDAEKSATATVKLPGPLAEKGELIFSDDFERAELGSDWQPLIPTFTVAEGILKGTQTRDDHGAVGRVYRPMKDIVAEFKFQFAGSPTFNVVFDDKNLRDYSHAGHICRVAITPRQIRLGDDKEGIMRNDIFQMRRSGDSTEKAKAEELLKGRTAICKVPVEVERWHSMRIEIAGDEMRVSLNGAAIGFLKSPGIAHPTKGSMHFTVNGDSMLFDDVRIWAAK